MAVTRGTLALPASRPHRNVPHGTAGGPIPLAGFAEMPGLIDVVVVVVAELRLQAVASGTREDLVGFLQGFLLTFRIFPVLDSLRFRGFFIDRGSFGIHGVWGDPGTSYVPFIERWLVIFLLIRDHLFFGRILMK